MTRTPLRAPLAATLRLALPFGVLALLGSGCMASGSMRSDAMRSDAASMGGPTTRAGMDRMMAGWSPASRTAAAMMTEKYGMPDEMTASMATWMETGPFTRTVVYARAVPHRFPAPHDDVLEQFVSYRVPLERYDDLAMYDGSVIVERTKGEMSARCDMEPLNILALNLAHEIVTGAMTVERARATYAEQATAFKQGRPAPYTERLRFDPPASGADPDQPAPMTGGMN